MSEHLYRPDPPEGPDESTLRRVASEIEREFPLVARRTGLVLFDVDPHHLQAQWQVEPGQLEQTRGAFPAGAADVRLQLRLLRPAAPAGERQAAVYTPPGTEMEPEGAVRFEAGDHDTPYQAELGLVSVDGGWLLLARSNRAWLPRPVGRPIPQSGAEAGEPAPECPPTSADEEAADSTPRSAEPPAPYRRPTRAADDESPPFDATLAESGVPLAPDFPLPRAGTGWSPEEPFLRVIVVLKPAVAGGESVPLPFSPGRKDASARPRSLRDNGLEPPNPYSTGGDLLGGVSASSKSASADRPFATRAGDLPVFPPYDPQGALSSGILRDDAGGARSATELRAELLVYGRAQPGSLVRLFGQSLKVGSNGRFFLRRTLEDAGRASRVFSEFPELENPGPETE